MNVTPVQVTKGSSATFIEGMMYYSFSNFKMTPRNNMDFGSIIVSIQEIVNAPNYEIQLYPNPAQDRVYIEIDET